MYVLIYLYIIYIYIYLIHTYLMYHFVFIQCVLMFLNGSLGLYTWANITPVSHMCSGTMMMCLLCCSYACRLFHVRPGWRWSDQRPGGSEDDVVTRD